MEARTHRSLILSWLLLGSLMISLTTPAWGASFRTRNFICEAPTARQAKLFCEAAENFRRDLAIEWLGHELPPWDSPCPITCEVSPNMGAGGATSFIFQNGDVYGWRMSVQGSEVRILDSVLPHEVTHTIFATHFRQPLPRWADEGACTTVEHPSEKARHHKLLITFLKTNRGIPFDRMFAMKEYPKDILPLYAQGHSLARLLIAQNGKREFLEFVGDGMTDENWPRALRDHYGYTDLGQLQVAWIDWVRAGSPLDIQSPRQIAKARQHQTPGNTPSVTFANDASRPNRLASTQSFDQATQADNSPLTHAPRGIAPVNMPLPPTDTNAWLPWRNAAPTATAAPTPPSRDLDPTRRSIYQAVRPQPLTPTKQRVLQ